LALAAHQELAVTIKADLLHVGAGRLVEVAGVELPKSFGGSLTDGGGEARRVVGVDV